MIWPTFREAEVTDLEWPVIVTFSYLVLFNSLSLCILYRSSHASFIRVTINTNARGDM